jgi:hypothetical protein
MAALPQQGWIDMGWFLAACAVFGLVGSLFGRTQQYQRRDYYPENEYDNQNCDNDCSYDNCDFDYDSGSYSDDR